MIVTGTQNTKKHGGRPTVAEARRLSKAVTVKFSQKDYEILMNRSKKANKHLAEYIRDSALNSEVAQQPLEVVTKDYRMLVGMANNLNQLTKMAHQQGIYYVYIPLNSLLGDISHIVREYKQNTDKKRKNDRKDYEGCIVQAVRPIRDRQGKCENPCL